jgi:hypothetical protein
MSSVVRKAEIGGSEESYGPSYRRRPRTAKTRIHEPINKSQLFLRKIDTHFHVLRIFNSYFGRNDFHENARLISRLFPPGGAQISGSTTTEHISKG